MEQDGFCKKVIRARMADGMAHVGPITGDITEFKPPVLKGGFPCGDPRHLKVCMSLQALREGWVCCAACHVIVRALGVSRAGKQRGRDHRETCLIEHVFRVMDESSALLGCHSSVISVGCILFRGLASDLRYFCFLENVANLLAPKLRELLRYVVKDSIASCDV